MKLNERKKLSQVLLALAPLAAIYATGKIRMAGPETVVQIPMRFGDIEEMAEGMKTLKLMIYGPHKEAAPIH